MTIPCADFESAHDAIAHYLDAKSADAPEVISLAAAGPMVDGTIRFTNNHWSVSARDLAASFAGAEVRVLNDFNAIAYAIPHLADGDILQVGLPEPGPLATDDATVGVVGPGTGLGAVGLRLVDNKSIPVVSEGGHIGFAPATQVQLDILRVLRERYDRVSTERLVAGEGLENVHWALGRLHGQDWPIRTAAEIFDAAQNNADGRAAEAVHMFFEVLGQFAGDFALAIGAHDGIFIAGGIVPRYPQLFANSGFRAGFENKGRVRSMLEKIPTQLVLHENPGLLGAAVVASDVANA